MTASATKHSIIISADDIRISRVSALACNIHMLEAALPSPIPGVKPGLTNIVTMVLLRQDGWGTAAWVSILRLCGSHMALGTLLTPTFVIGFAGAATSLACMGILYSAGRTIFSAIGISAAAATGHVSAQFAIVWLCFLPQQGLLYLLPFAITFALISGTINGFFAETFTP